MRLIDADALMKKLGITNMDCNECQWGKRYGEICCCCSRGGDFEDACIAIENAPTIEQPQTGMWIERESGAEDKQEGWPTVIVCSQCDFPATTFYSEDCEQRTQIKTRFCPNCGVRMVTQ